MCNFWHLVRLPSFMPKYGNYQKTARISETTTRRAKISSIWTPWGRKRVYVQLLELWQMTKLVLKQSIKAHGPLVFIFKPLSPCTIFATHFRVISHYSDYVVCYPDHIESLVLWHGIILTRFTVCCPWCAYVLTFTTLILFRLHSPLLLALHAADDIIYNLIALCSGWSSWEWAGFLYLSYKTTNQVWWPIL